MNKRSTRLRWVAALAAVGGLVLGVFLGTSARAAGTPLAAVTAWKGRAERVDRLERLERRVERLHRRSGELDRLWGEVATLRHRAEELDGREAFEQAVALGIPEAIIGTRPALRPELVRRMSVALVREARRQGLDPLLLTAVARVESTFNPWAVSPVGAVGLMQVRAITGRELLRGQGGDLLSEAELFDIETNVALGAAYLARMLERFGSLETALVAYNRGPTGARAALSGPDSDRVLAGYPKRVMRALDALSHSPVANVSAGAPPCSEEAPCTGET